MWPIFLCRFVPELEQYIKKTDIILQTFKRRFNVAAPINQLPVEILTRVFEIVRFHRIFGNKFPSPFATLDTGEICRMKDAISWVPRILHICNHWREVALFTPSLYCPIPCHAISQFASTPKGVDPIQHNSMMPFDPLPTTPKL